MSNIEQKYLLDESIEDLLSDLELKKEQVQQFYTKIKSCQEVQYKKVNTDYSLIITHRRDENQEQENKKISKEKFYKEIDNKIGHTINKDRFYISLDGYKYEIYRYSGVLKDIYILYRNLKNDNIKQQKFEIPNFLKSYIITEITDNPRYKSHNLAILGNPKKNISKLYSTFKNLDERRISKVEDSILKNAPLSDSIRLILYQFYYEMISLKEEIIDKKREKEVELFQKKLQKSILLVDEFYYIFDTTILSKVQKHLKYIEKKLTLDKEIDAFSSNLKILENSYKEKEINKIFAKLDKKTYNKINKIIFFLQTREFSIILTQYKHLITEGDQSFNQYHQIGEIHQVINKKLSLKYKQAKFTIKENSYCKDYQSYSNIKESIKKLKIVLETFHYLYEKDKFNEASKSINRLYNLLDEFTNIHTRCNLVNNHIKNQKDIPKFETNRTLDLINISCSNHQLQLINSIEQAIKDFKHNSSLKKIK